MNRLRLWELNLPIATCQDGSTGLSRHTGTRIPTLPLRNNGSADTARQGPDDSNDSPSCDASGGERFRGREASQQRLATGQIPILTRFYQPGIVLLLTSEPSPHNRRPFWPAGHPSSSTPRPSPQFRSEFLLRLFCARAFTARSPSSPERNSR